MTFAFILLLGLSAICAYAGFITLKMAGQRQTDGAFVITSPLTAGVLVLASVALSAMFLNAAFAVL